MSNTKKRSRKHLVLEQRNMIERYLFEGASFARIACDLGVSPSTIHREVYRNRRSDGPSRIKGADRTDCEFFRKCKVRRLCELDTFHTCLESKLCKRCTKLYCHDRCQKYKKRICRTVECAPFVCNGCRRYTHCASERFRYSAKSAQAMSELRGSEARSGFDLDASEVEYLTNTVIEGLKLGQSIHHIFAANDLPCSERTFYRLVENESIPIMNIHLAKKVKYKKRKQIKAVSAHARGFYLGHEYSDYMKLSLEERSITTEVDTVWGRQKDKKTILSLHRTDLHFQIYLLLPERTTSAVVDALDWLEACCEGRFAEFFGLLLLDRGSEFDDIERMERSLIEGKKRTRAFFTDPNRPDQKGSCEKNHVELRKILPKGTSLEDMDAYVLAEICSHVNSTIRRGCGDSTPIQLARLCLPEELFDHLGLRLVPPNEVIATPGALYGSNK